MFIISNKEMMLACANAGILGSMPSLNARTHEQLRLDLAWLRERTDRAFAINITVGLTDPERVMADVEACVDFEVPVMITSYGNPEPLVKRVKPTGMTVLHDVIHLKHAKKAQAAGVDAIIAVSQGAGGHAGRVNPYVLIPYLRKHLSIPIVAAGCIGGGDQVAAALSLGAELAYMGTRFIASTECGASDRYKQLVVDATHEDIVYTDKVSGIHANFIASTVPDETQPDYRPEAAKRWLDIWSAGQGVSLINDVQPIEQIVDDVVREFHDARARLG
jgi:nitronate monooxygenase